MESRLKLVVLGTSMGGLHALDRLLRGLAPDFPLPLAIVQHRGADLGPSQMTRLLQLSCVLPINECNDKEPIVGGRVYVAPADYHLLVDEGRFALSVDERVLFARPSIDVLFESAADEYRDGVLGVILTGANSDGTRGAARIKARGGTVVAQDPRTAEAPTRPMSANEAGGADRVRPLDDIAAYLNAVSAMRET